MGNIIISIIKGFSVMFKKPVYPLDIFNQPGHRFWYKGLRMLYYSVFDIPGLLKSIGDIYGWDTHS